ncbi:MAG: HAMP domain-containing histidine kinase [Campylobacterales bacterium]|nr:HAMP domain-containing histidine kinase [Campylobacterales bacterium]
MDRLEKGLHVSKKELLYDAIERHLILSRHNAAGEIIEQNARFTALFGSHEGHRSVNPLLEEGVLPTELSATLQRGETWRGRKSCYLENERELIVDLTAIPMMTPQMSEVLVLIEDVTAVVHAGRAQQQKQIQLKIDRLMEQKRHYREINRIKDSFLMLFTHELRTPLNAVINFSRHLLKHLNQIEHSKVVLMREEAKLTLQSGEQMLDMIENITLAVRLRDQTLTPHYESIELLELVQRLCAKFDPQALSLQININPALRIEGDYKAFGAMVYNLIGNAVTYGGGSVRIACRVEEGRFVLCVADNGQGFRHPQARLFDLFEQADVDAMTREDKGIGVGLYVVKKVCDLFGYGIKLGSDPLLGGAQVKIYGAIKELHVPHSHR